MRRWPQLRRSNADRPILDFALHPVQLREPLRQNQWEEPGRQLRDSSHELR